MPAPPPAMLERQRFFQQQSKNMSTDEIRSWRSGFLCPRALYILGRHSRILGGSRVDLIIQRALNTRRASGFGAMLSATGRWGKPI